MIKIKLNLAAFTNVMMKKKGKGGKEVIGIFIPIKNNHLFKSDKGAIYFDAIAFEMKEKKEWATHIIKQSFSKDVRENMSDEEQKSQPIFGNLIIDSGYSEVNNSASDQTYSDDENDELPF